MVARKNGVGIRISPGFNASVFQAFKKILKLYPEADTGSSQNVNDGGMK